MYILAIYMDCNKLNYFLQNTQYFSFDNVYFHEKNEIEKVFVKEVSVYYQLQEFENVF